MKIIKPQFIMNIIDNLLCYNPFKKDYNKMVHNICVEFEKEKFIKTMFTLSQEQRDNMLLELQQEIISTKSD